MRRRRPVRHNPAMTSYPVVDDAHPFSAEARPELTGGQRVGVLLSHGFTGSPFSMRPWGEYLADLGYAVEVPRLPGHGTHWKEMNRTGWRDWYGEITATFADLHRRCDQVAVCGLSMGGALVLRLAADRPADVAAVVVVNPAVSTTRRDVKLLPVVKHVVPSMPGIASDIKKPGALEGGYERTPTRAADSMFSAWPALRSALPAITAPLLYFRSSVDHVVDDSSEPIIVGSVSSRTIVQRRLEDSYHVATLDNDAEQIFTGSAEFIAEHTWRTVAEPA